jgi:hypothetical protein
LNIFIFYFLFSSKLSPQIFLPQISKFQFWLARYIRQSRQQTDPPFGGLAE